MLNFLSKEALRAKKKTVVFKNYGFKNIFRCMATHNPLLILKDVRSGLTPC